MTTSEPKLIADHMGHNLDIHTNVYRIQSSLLENISTEGWCIIYVTFIITFPVKSDSI